VNEAKKLTLEDFDAFEELFENRWNPNTFGADSVLSFLQETVHPDDASGENYNCLISSLVQIDIGRWWMHWEKKANSAVQLATAAEDLLEQFSQRATLEKYLQLLPAIEDNEFWRELIEFEVTTRHQWGDQIGACYFNSRFGTQFNDPKRTPEIVLRCDLAEASVGHASPKFPLRGCTLIGRQRSFDACTSLVEHKIDGNRIVIAARDELEISREQLTIQLLCPSVAVVQNTSQKNAILLSPNRLLNCQERAVVKLPFTVQLYGRKLRCYQETLH
jgi:hypothetical protein